MFLPGTTLTLDDDAGYQDVNGLSASVLRELAGMQKQARAAAER
jgi:hypothetical protein